MWGSRYFGSKYFGRHYWGPAVAGGPPPDTGGGGGGGEEVTSEGLFGELVSVPGVECLDDFGLLRLVCKDAGTLRIEYSRRGQAFAANQDFEIPERYIKYTRWYALWQALRREGDGQDLELAEHYRQRWEAGVQRMTRRKQMLQVQRKYVMGSSSTRRGMAPPKPKLPWPYGE